MSIDLALSAQNLSKVYQIYDRPLDRLRQMLSRGQRRFYREFAALDNVSFSLPRGQVLGLVGRNGAGKSTLLQIICQTLTPSAGQLQVNGRIAALLELGAGFNPDFTGRENVFLNASVLGLTHDEISQRFDDIVDFSGIRDFIDQPVKTYSSGMYVRLAFAIATSVDPDILVVDEALSVGDGAFARKSFDRIMALRERGATILFCSHSLYQIEAFCDQAIWLEKGRMRAHGEPAEVIARYQQFLDSDGTVGAEASPAPRQTGSARILKVWSSVNGGEPASCLKLSNGRDELRVRLRFASDTQLPLPTAAITFHLPDGRTVSSGASWIKQTPLCRDERGEGEIEARFPDFPLLKGDYHLSAHLLCEKGIHLYDSANAVCQLEVSQDHLEQGLVSLPQTWQASLPEQALVQAPLPSGDEMRWQVRPASADDEAALLRLFRQCFGYDMPPEQWRWKYAGSRSPGFLAERNGQVVAFYGGMPRPMQYFGEAAQAVQIGDVMVAPEERSILTRRGAFFRVASAFLEASIGYDKPYLLGFGFPTARALRLAERQNLYAKVGEMHEWRWPASPGRSSLRLRGRMLGMPLSGQTAGKIDRLWQEMGAELASNIVGVRDAAWLQQRFAAHPTQHYQIWLVEKRLTGAALGALVLRQHDGEIELLDVIAPPSRLPQLIAWAQRLAGRSGRQSLRFWASSALTPALSACGGERHALDLQIPCNIWSPGPPPAKIAGFWWLTAGDTDFR